MTIKTSTTDTTNPNPIIEFTQYSIDTASLKILKSSRGVALFTEQLITYGKESETLWTNKVLNNEEAIELRDYLIQHYPLGV